jgi:hypothetical protein
MAAAYIARWRAQLRWSLIRKEEGAMMRSILNTSLAACLMVLALASCKGSRQDATPSGAGNSEAGATGGSAAAPGSQHGNTGMSSDNPAATTPGTTGAPAGTPTATGGNPNASGQPVTPPPDGKTNTTH